MCCAVELVKLRDTGVRVDGALYRRIELRLTSRSIAEDAIPAIAEKR